VCEDVPLLAVEAVYDDEVTEAAADDVSVDFCFVSSVESDVSLLEEEVDDSLEESVLAAITSAALETVSEGAGSCGEVGWGTESEPVEVLWRVAGEELASSAVSRETSVLPVADVGLSQIFGGSVPRSFSLHSVRGEGFPEDMLEREDSEAESSISGAVISLTSLVEDPLSLCTEEGDRRGRLGPYKISFN